MNQVSFALRTLPEWADILDQISSSLDASLAAVAEREQHAPRDSTPALAFSRTALDEIDARLRGFDERLDGIRALAQQIESTLETDESAVCAFQRSAVAARVRTAPAARLS